MRRSAKSRALTSSSSSRLQTATVAFSHWCSLHESTLFSRVKNRRVLEDLLTCTKTAGGQTLGVLRTQPLGRCHYSSRLCFKDGRHSHTQTFKSSQEVSSNRVSQKLFMNITFTMSLTHQEVILESLQKAFLYLDLLKNPPKNMF